MWFGMRLEPGSMSIPWFILISQGIKMNREKMRLFLSRFLDFLLR